MGYEGLGFRVGGSGFRVREEYGALEGSEYPQNPSSQM